MREKRNLLEYLGISLKGMAMGAADIVPGVSGGTLAFIMGFYEELVETIDGLDLKFFKSWKQNGLKETWLKYNLSFLVFLGLGVAISIALFAKIIENLIEVHPIKVWAFFFGLVSASLIYVAKQIKKWNAGIIISLLIASAFAYFISGLNPMAETDSTWFLFVAGFVAIIAMILPGISGAFILLLIGAYQPVIGLLNEFTSALRIVDFEAAKSLLGKILIFMLGAATGLKAFSKVLNWMFSNHKNLTLAALTGFIFGALNKIWPWKKVIETRINSSGQEVPFIEKSVSPLSFNGDPQILWAVIFMLIGFGLIFGIEFLARKKQD